MGCKPLMCKRKKHLSSNWPNPYYYHYLQILF